MTFAVNAFCYWLTYIAVSPPVLSSGLWQQQDRLGKGMPVVHIVTLVQVAYNPQVLLPCSKLGESSEVLVQDASALAAPQEELSFWQLQVIARIRPNVAMPEICNVEPAESNEVKAPTVRRQRCMLPAHSVGYDSSDMPDSTALAHFAHEKANCDCVLSLA